MCAPGYAVLETARRGGEGRETGPRVGMLNGTGPDDRVGRCGAVDNERCTIPGQVPRGPNGMSPDPVPTVVTATLGVAVLGVAVVLSVFVGMLFLTVAPSNVLSKQHASAISAVVEPEFSQQWQVFAPDPLQANLQLEVRARLTGRAGAKGPVTDWFNISADDVAAIRSDVLPARRLINELRNAWNWFYWSHDAKNAAVGRSGERSTQYLRRLVLGRLDGEEVDGTITSIQVRVLQRPIAPPKWTGETAEKTPEIRTLPWWKVFPADRPAGASDALLIAGR